MLGPRLSDLGHRLLYLTRLVQLDVDATLVGRGWRSTGVCCGFDEIGF